MLLLELEEYVLAMNVRLLAAEATIIDLNDRVTELEDVVSYKIDLIYDFVSIYRGFEFYALTTIRQFVIDDHLLNELTPAYINSIITSYPHSAVALTYPQYVMIYEYFYNKFNP